MERSLRSRSGPSLHPTDVIFDRISQRLLICDRKNRRVVRWSLRDDTTHGETIIRDIDCNCLTIDRRNRLYVTDVVKHAVIRWQLDDLQGTVVAGGNSQGDNLNQLHYPTSLFVDDNHTLYIADTENHRIVKWMPVSNKQQLSSLVGIVREIKRHNCLILVEW